MSSSSSFEVLDQDLNKNLSLSSTPQTPNVLPHFLHEHPLIFKVAEETNEAKETICCDICDVHIELDDQFYHCKKCNFSIHKSCAELPKQVRNMLHPAHLLGLTIRKSSFYCDACDAYISRVSSYSCSICNFDLHIKCIFPTTTIQTISIMSSSSSSLEVLDQDLNKNLSPSSNPQTPNVLQHFLHDHPLIFKVAETNDKKETICCDICDVDIELDGRHQFYHCEECSFSIHKSCAELPKQVRNMLHPAHLLELIKRHDFYCDACGDIFSCSSYKCYECDFDIDIKCLFLSYNSNSIMSSSHSTSLELLGQDLKYLSLSSNPQTPYYVLQHFLHDCLLILKVTKTNNDDGENPRGCNICHFDIDLDGQFYDCKKCSFSIHKTCAELPKQVRNMLHPAHLLELSIRKEWFNCDGCNAHLICARYRCSICKFDLDVKCVARNIFEEPQGHKEHKFEFMRPTLFTCDACGLDEVTKSHISSVCTNCLLHVHIKCISSSFPFTIKEPRHSHKLSLTYSFQMGHVDFADKFCKICFKKMNNVLFMYSCAECGAYITHVSCGLRTNVLDVSVVTETENQELSRPDLKETHQNDQIKHFSHRHSLFLINVDEHKGDNIICDGCVRPISAPYYTCDQCSFFLHRDCVELPKTITHPFHEHKLTLRAAWDKLSLKYTRNIPGYKCRGCDALCNGFIYECASSLCYFHLDVGCSFLPDILHHEGHNCELTLIDSYAQQGIGLWARHEKKYKSNCKACGLSCFNKFICEGCDFDLDLVCASLPKMIPHECPKQGWNKHPYKLKYHDIENVAGMYICDECEGERSINHWYYYCEDCKYSAHPRCLVGHERIKYGRSYEVDEHPHRVRLLKEPRLGWNHSCTTCEEPLKKSEPALFCEECNIYLHYTHIVYGCCSLVETD